MGIFASGVLSIPLRGTAIRSLTSGKRFTKDSGHDDLDCRQGRRGRKPGTLFDRLAEIKGSGLLGDAVALRFDWRVAYTADQYVDLLTTFSMHTTLSPGERDTL